MALLLHIDTATAYGAVAFSENERILFSLENKEQKEHASFLHPAIAAVAKQTGVTLNELDAVAVVLGPGSYTGLRVGLAAAKGLCYALQKPLIAVNTLQAMALAAAEDKSITEQCSKPFLFVPMIDARRMEVFTAVYTPTNELHTSPQALVLHEEIFSFEKEQNCLIFSGDGSRKLDKIFKNEEIHISNREHNIGHVAAIAYKHFCKQTFEDIAYTEPLYIKPFYFLNNVRP